MNYCGFKKVFKENDQDGDGGLTKQELRDWMVILAGEDKPAGMDGLKRSIYNNLD